MRSLAAAGAMLAMSMSLPAFGQDAFPSKPIEMIIPTQAGGGTDSSLRLLAEIAGQELGQKVVILNKPGGSGAVGVIELTKARPDGYTIGGVWFAPLTVIPHTLGVPYKTTDYAPVSLSAIVPLVFCVKPDFPAKDGAGLLDELKANPGKYTYGTDGVGGASQLAAERIFAKVGAKARAIPFTDSGQILSNFLGGHVAVYVGVIGPIQPYVQKKEAKCLLLTTPGGNASVPDAAGLDSLSLGDASTMVWRGVIAPKDVPADRLAILEKAFRTAAASDRFRSFMEGQGGLAAGQSAAEFRSVIDKDYEAFGAVVQALGIGKK